MTHFMHRLYTTNEDLQGDWAIIAMPSKGLNDKGSQERLVLFGKILLKHSPINFGVNCNKSIMSTMLKGDELLKEVKDGSIINGVFDQEENFVKALSEVVTSDLLLSITVQGDFNEIKRICSQLRIQIHTVQHSLQKIGVKGPIGKENLQVTDYILKITTMCGHNYVGTKLVKHIIKKIKENSLTLEEGSHILASFCRCGSFNITKAKRILESNAIE